MKSLRYVVLLSLIALLLASCAGLPPVFPTEETAIQGAEETSVTAPAERTALPVATEALATAAPVATSETAVVTATVASPAATIAVTEVVTGTAPAETTAEAPTTEAPATPTADQVMGANPLTGVVWEWTALLKTSPAVQSVVPDPAAYTIVFGDDGNAQIRADCNNAIAAYTLENDALTIKIGPVTLAACPPGSLSDLMLASLSGVGSYMIDGGDLILRVAESGDSMLFRNGGLTAPSATTEAAAGAAAPTPVGTPAAAAPAEAEPTLVETVWQWERFVDVATGQATMDIEDPAQYTVTFMDDGTAAMKADCNQAAATYTVDGAEMSINIGPVTLAACGPNSLSDTFLINLTSVATYVIEDGKLNLDLMADGGRMILGAAE
jgi:heat shock protein HslJ